MINVTIECVTDTHTHMPEGLEHLQTEEDVKKEFRKGRVNENHIKGYYPSTEGTLIDMGNDENVYMVAETVKQIDRLIKNAESKDKGLFQNIILWLFHRSR